MQKGMHLTVLDLKISDSLRTQFSGVNFIEGNINDLEAMQSFIKNDIIISFLPASMHIVIAKLCIVHKKHLITASYVSPDIEELNEQATALGLNFLFEMGLDPGIDHMSAMHMIDTLNKNGHEIKSFKSYCGALVAKHSDNNPWHYKFTWNPMNVITAAQNLASYKENKKVKFKDPKSIFSDYINITTNQENFEGYVNRDALHYIKKYGLMEAETFIRGTLRGKGFCEAWQILIDLGLTNNQNLITIKGMSILEVISSFIAEKHLTQDIYISIQNQTNNKSESTLKSLKYLDLASQVVTKLNTCTPAQFLLEILIPKWQLLENDTDRIVLWHEITTLKNQNIHKHTATLDITGASQHKTAIAKTVSLPAAFAAQLILEKKINLPGIQIPTHPAIYTQIIPMLAENGIEMQENYNL